MHLTWAGVLSKRLWVLFCYHPFRSEGKNCLGPCFHFSHEKKQAQALFAASSYLAPCFLCCISDFPECECVCPLCSLTFLALSPLLPLQVTDLAAHSQGAPGLYLAAYSTASLRRIGFPQTYVTREGLSLALYFCHTYPSPCGVIVNN